MDSDVDIKEDGTDGSDTDEEEYEQSISLNNALIDNFSIEYEIER